MTAILFEAISRRPRFIPGTSISLYVISTQGKIETIRMLEHMK